MAGIGFELRKLYRQEGLLQNIKAYAYSTTTTVGPMLLCLVLIFAQQIMMKQQNVSYLDKELFVATLAYCFVFSIIVTSGISMLVTRYIADLIYEKKYTHVIDAYYGSLLVIIPIAALFSILFLWHIDENILYKIVAYIFFIELVVIWMQNVFMSALKDYRRIFRGFVIAVLLSIVSSHYLYILTELDAIVVALLGINIGFASILISSSLHFEQIFPRSKNVQYFAFLKAIRRYPTAFFSGLFIYSGVYIHSLIYWFFSEENLVIANHYKLMPMYDVSVFYAYLTVLPSLILFVVVVETDFYERFLNYYQNVTEGGTYESLQIAKKKMQKVLLFRIGFISEIQLLFTVLGIALGILLLPRIGFSMEQLDLYITLCFAYFFFILMFIILHILMYFDDKKGILYISFLFICLSSIFTFVTMRLELHGIGMFLASFIGLCVTSIRMNYILKNIDYYTYCPQPMLAIGQKEKLKLKRKNKMRLPTTILLLTMMLAGCSMEIDTNNQPINETSAEQVVATTNNTEITIDDKRIYERDEDDSVKTLYITILPDSTNDGLDWYSLNQLVDRYSEESLKVIVAEGAADGSGPQTGMFGADTTTANAKISLRGNSARNFQQKSYKINLLDSAGTWNNQKTINLNKHIGDNSRLRNKLSFDLMETIPNISSLRTQFIHLYVKDLTADEMSYQDYGLYTHVEQPNKRFLRNHLLDENGYLYKVFFFEFDRYPDLIKSHTDPTYDKKQFETILEIKGREDHDKLIQMLNDVNNYDISINEIMNHYFVEENFLTWLAINILMDNMDTDANNYYLYSPLNSDKWLILPWDYDDGWEQGRLNNNFDSYRGGISNYWGNLLLNRYFRYQENVDKLTNKLEELNANYINEQTVSNQLSKYKHIPLQFVSKYPDIEYLPIKINEYENTIQTIINTPKQSLQRYYEDLQKPKPFFINNTYEVKEDKHVFSWGSSFDLQADSLYYTATLSTDPAMHNIITKAEKIRESYFSVANLPPGIYYLSVTVEDEQGNTNSAFDQYKDEETGTYYFHTIQIEVTE